MKKNIKICQMLRPDPFRIFAFLLVMFVSSAGHAQDTSALSSTMKEIITGAGSPPHISLRGTRLYTPELLRDFYLKRDFRPAWVSPEGPLQKTDALITAISTAEREGLTPEYYHFREISGIMNEIRDAKARGGPPPGHALVELELFLSDAYLELGCHFSAGCVNPVTVEAEWFAKSGELDVTSVFEKALHENRIRESLLELLPPEDMYTQLKKQLVTYRTISSQGGWHTIPEGESLKKGSRDKRVKDLGKRLAAEGYLVRQPEDPLIFDDLIEKAVIRFQTLHGLVTDGVAGRNTLKALNVSAGSRARQIELNMERLRWISRNLGQRYIRVNIADFSLNVIEDDRPVLSMKIVAGKPYWHTPVFSAQMTYLILNPFWNVPQSIARDEIVRKVRNDQEYLLKQNMKIIRGWGKEESFIDPSSIDWSTVGEKRLDFRFRQDPGPLNPLGRIKFMFPNQFNVYLHDTPSRSLFQRTVRSFSHGCIRLEKPIDLAEYLLAQDTSWTREKILATIDSRVTREVRLPRPIDVHILYLTAWVDEQGQLHFRNDIYGRDRKLDRALRQKPSSS